MIIVASFLPWRKLLNLDSSSDDRNGNKRKLTHFAWKCAGLPLGALQVLPPTPLLFSQEGLLGGPVEKWVPRHWLERVPRPGQESWGVYLYSETDRGGVSLCADVIVSDSFEIAVLLDQD